MRRPTKRAGIILMVGGLLALVATTAQAGWLFVMAAGVAGLLGASVLAPQGLRHLSVERSGPPAVVAGDYATVAVKLHNEGKRATPPLRIEDHHPGLEDDRFFVERAGPGSSLTASSARLAPKRGVFDGGRARVISGAPFGILSARRDIPVEGELVVLPRWVELKSFPLRDASASPLELEGEMARVGAGSEFVGLRNYRPGDPRRHVHWRSSARRGELIVREHQEEVMGPVVIALAGDDTAEAPDSAFETLVSAAASIAIYARSMGHPLQLVAPGSAGEEPRRAERPTRSGILRWLAELEPVDADLREVLSAGLGPSGRGSTVVLLATSTGQSGASLLEAAGQAVRAGARPLTVMADASTWDEKKDPSHPDAGFILTRGGDLQSCLRG